MPDQIMIIVLHRHHHYCPCIPFHRYKMNSGGMGGSVLTQTSAREVSIQIDFKKVHCWCVPATCIHIYIYTYTPTRTHTQACEGFCYLDPF